MTAREECACGYKVGHLVGGQPALSLDPNCPVHGSRIEQLREALITIADRLEDEGCQCDASDEYVYKCNLCVANDALKSTISTLNPDKG